MFSVQSYELQFPGLSLAAPISDMKKDLGALKACPFYSPLWIAPIKKKLPFLTSLASRTSSEPGYSQHSTAELRAWSCSHWGLPQVGSGRWWPVGFAHIFRKEVANHMEMLVYISKKFIFFFLEAATSHRPCFRDPLKAVGHGKGILEKSHCLLFPKRALGLQTSWLILPVTNLKCFGALLFNFRFDKNTPTHP